MLRHSGFLFGYVDSNDQFVGFARVLSDRVFKGLLPAPPNRPRPA